MKEIKLNKDQKRELLDKIKAFFLEERDEELGDLSAEIVLDFFLKELGDVIYNKAIDDAHGLMQDIIEDILSLQRI